jgi:hypothetical protein
MTQYYKRITGSVIQGTASTVTEPLGTLVVTNDGELRLHDGVTAGGNAVGGGGGNELVNGSYNFILGVDGTVNFDPSGANGKGVLQTTADLQFIANTATYTFGADGGLTFPGTQTITDDAGDLVITNPNLRAGVSIGVHDPSETPTHWYFASNGQFNFPSGAGFVRGDSGQLKTNDTTTQSLDFRDATGRGFYTNGDGFSLRGNGSNTWQFGTTGSITFPDNSVQTTAYVPNNGNSLVWRGAWDPQGSYASNIDVVSYNGSSYVKISGNGNSGSSPDLDTVRWAPVALKGADGSSGGGGSGFQLSSSTVYVTLTSDGLLTLPNSGLIDFNNPYTRLKNTVTGQGAQLGSPDDQNYVNVDNTAVTIQVNSDGVTGPHELPQHNWTFGTDGTTTLASGVEISNTDTFNFLSWNTGTALIIADVPYTAGSFIYIPSSSDTNGSLGIVNTNTAGSIMLTQGSGNTNNSSQLYVDNSGTTINNILGGISKTWKFGTDGSITFPDNSVQTIAWTGTVAYGNVTGTPNLSGYTTTATVNTLIANSLTNVITKASGLVNAGVDVVLDNLKARIPTSGNRSLQVSTVSGTYTVYGSDVYYSNGVGGATIDGATPLSVTTTPAYLRAANNFGVAGQTDTWTIVDTGAGLAWRITMIIGVGYNNNMISIERLI